MSWPKVAESVFKQWGPTVSVPSDTFPVRIHWLDEMRQSSRGQAGWGPHSQVEFRLLNNPMAFAVREAIYWGWNVPVPEEIRP